MTATPGALESPGRPNRLGVGCADGVGFAA